MKIMSKIRERIFGHQVSKNTRRFTALKGFDITDPGWKLTDASGNFWRPSPSGPKALGKYKPSDRGTLYVDLSIYENKLYATTLLMKTIEFTTHPNDADDRYVVSARCKITGLEIKDSEEGLFETLLQLAETRGYLFSSED
jgi:hypothetical protein